PLSEPGSVNAETCDSLLREARPAHPGQQRAKVTVADGHPDLPMLASAAFAAYQEDHAGIPRRWDEVKEYIERYFKPLLCAHLGGVAGATSDSVSLSDVAEALDSDRGT